jgi:hypothetical protein
MTDLTEKNLEAVLLNLTKTDRPIRIKPTTWFGNPAKTAQWYKCPNCAKQSPLTIEWVSPMDDELLKIYGWRFESYGQSDNPLFLGQNIVDEAKQEIIDGLRKVEAALKEKNT